MINLPATITIQETGFSALFRRLLPSTGYQNNNNIQTQQSVYGRGWFTGKRGKDLFWEWEISWDTRHIKFVQSWNKLLNIHFSWLSPAYLFGQLFEPPPHCTKKKKNQINQRFFLVQTQSMCAMAPYTKLSYLNRRNFRGLKNTCKLFWTNFRELRNTQNFAR